MILRLKLYRLITKVGIYALSISSFYFGWWVWQIACQRLGRPAEYQPFGHIGQMLLGTLIWVLLSEHYQVTNFDELFRERTGARAAFSACTTSTFVLLGLLYFSRNNAFPRGLLVSDVLALLVSTIILHATFRILFRSRAHLANPTRLLVIGADRFARKAATRLQRVSFANCEVAGYVRLPGQDVHVRSERIYDFDGLAGMNSASGFDEALIAIHPSDFVQIPKIIPVLNRLCLPARAVIDFGEGIVVKERLFQLGNMQMLDLTATPAESLDYALLKRAFDICFSSIVLMLAAPLLGLVAALVKITSPGPVLFVQERVGLNGKPFKMYKFRTMRVAPVNQSDTLWTTPEDARKTWIGSFLRKTSLDELPQFVNVLKGDMSVVGPRPERPHFVHKFLQEVTRYNSRHALKVGITGWAQVNGWRGDTSIEKRVEYDLYYLQNWSLVFDLRIIVMTVFAGLVNKNAY